MKCEELRELSQEPAVSPGDQHQTVERRGDRDGERTGGAGPGNDT